MNKRRVATECTDRNARSCPICGICTCRLYFPLCDYTCTLHAHSSEHGTLQHQPEPDELAWPDFELGGEA